MFINKINYESSEKNMASGQKGLGDSEQAESKDKKDIGFEKENVEKNNTEYEFPPIDLLQKSEVPNNQKNA